MMDSMTTTQGSPVLTLICLLCCACSAVNIRAWSLPTLTVKDFTPCARYISISKTGNKVRSLNRLPSLNTAADWRGPHARTSPCTTPPLSLMPSLCSPHCVSLRAATAGG
jgi:hypothetical protein